MTGVLTQRGNLNAEMDTHGGKGRRQREGHAKTRPQARGASEAAGEAGSGGKAPPLQVSEGRGPVCT